MSTEQESTPLEMRLKQYERKLSEVKKYWRNSVILCSIGALVFLYGIFTGMILLLAIGFIVMGVFIFPVMRWPQKEKDLKEKILETEEEIIQTHRRSEVHTKKCPYCAEIIKADAVLCRYCGKELSEAIVRSGYRSRVMVPARLNQTTLRRLKGANLRYDDLKGANLIGADMEGVNLVGANLEATNLKGANLIDANMESANLVGANLSRANLQNANLTDANMEGVNLIGANMEATNLIGANMRDARVNRAKYSNATKWSEDFDPKARGAVIVEQPDIG